MSRHNVKSQPLKSILRGPCITSPEGEGENCSSLAKNMGTQTSSIEQILCLHESRKEKACSVHCILQNNGDVHAYD